MNGAISERVEKLVAEMENALKHDLATLEAREATFISHCAEQTSHGEPNCTLPDIPDLRENYYRQLEGECRLLEKALSAWLRKAEWLHTQRHRPEEVSCGGTTSEVR